MACPVSEKPGTRYEPVDGAEPKPGTRYEPVDGAGPKPGTRYEPVDGAEPKPGTRYEPADGAAGAGPSGGGRRLRRHLLPESILERYEYEWDLL